MFFVNSIYMYRVVVYFASEMVLFGHCCTFPLCEK